jgi:hypothetical protein
LPIAAKPTSGRSIVGWLASHAYVAPRSAISMVSVAL